MTEKGGLEILGQKRVRLDYNGELAGDQHGLRAALAGDAITRLGFVEGALMSRRAAKAACHCQRLLNAAKAYDHLWSASPQSRHKTWSSGKL